jgi:hypothetical protein
MSAYCFPRFIQETRGKSGWFWQWGYRKPATVDGGEGNLSSETAEDVEAYVLPFHAERRLASSSSLGLSTFFFSQVSSNAV